MTGRAGRTGCVGVTGHAGRTGCAGMTGCVSELGVNARIGGHEQGNLCTLHFTSFSEGNQKNREREVKDIPDFVKISVAGPE